MFDTWLLMFVLACLILAVAAIGYEALRAAGMRARDRKRKALRRYLDLVDTDRRVP